MSGVPTPASSGDRSRPRIGRYLITARLGRGGMGMVYRGHDEALDRDVAIKTLILENVDEESRKRFEIEAKAAAKLQHPNIITVFELSQDGKMPFIAMELLPGFDLEGLLRSGEPLLLPEKLDIIAQVCRGLHYAHERHVIHRDIKPSNIRLLDDGSVKIMDFGIAKLANTTLTRTGMMVGTVHYMCPEQIQGQPIDGRSDVFSVGVILYELLAGRRPFEGSADGGPTEVLYKIVQQSPPVLPDLGPHTARLQEIVSQSLAKKPSDRYANAARLADDLAELRSRVGSVSAPVPEVLETIHAARQLMIQGRIDESVTRLREMVERTPHSLEVRRALRVACREAARRSGPAKDADGDFPELTFQVGAMRETVFVDGTTADQGARGRASGDGRTLLVAGGLVLGFAVIAGVFLVLRSPSKDAPPRPADNTQGSLSGTTTGRTGSSDKPRLPDDDKHKVAEVGNGSTKTKTKTAAPPTAPPPVAAAQLGKLTLATDPPGAEVTLDGSVLASRTPVEVEIDTAVAHQVAFALDGHQPRRLAIPAGPARDLSVLLSPLGPPGTLVVTAPYPVDVTIGGRLVSKGQISASISVPAGRHAVNLTAPSVLLRTSPTVDVRGGETTVVNAPPLGQLNVQANPDSCEVFVNDISIGYLPILKKPIASGRHVVVFKWPDGARNQQTVEVPPGGPGYVIGEKP
jgi:hypothetical protein